MRRTSFLKGGTANEDLANMLSVDRFDDDDESIERAQTAKKNMSRALLYCNGARAKLPKVKKKILRGKSPFTILAPDEFPDKPATLHMTSPPGAHNSQFRTLSYQSFSGSSPKKDSELLCLNSPSMEKHLEADIMNGQPPWYVGYTNKTNPPDSSIIYAASRYGFRGSRSIRQYKTEPFHSPERTKTAYTPKFLDTSFRINEWVPPIRSVSFQSVSETNSPKLWPENTEYANGVLLKRPPSSILYNRETTIGNEASRDIPPSLSEYVERCMDVDKTLDDFARMESSNTFLSAPMTAQLKFDTMWNDRVR